MALSPGTRLGSYEVTAKIGQGGMGEVYRAHDTKLGRDVARTVGIGYDLPRRDQKDEDRTMSGYQAIAGKRVWLRRLDGTTEPGRPRHVWVYKRLFRRAQWTS